MVALLPNGMQQFLDGNGKPLANGKVYHYVPFTSPPVYKDTWLNYLQTATNLNPIPLNADGRCIAWGEGLYRQVVYDNLGNLVWDQLTSSGSATFYDFPVFISGKPADGEVYPVFNAVRNVSLPIGLVGSIATVQIPPASVATWLIQKNGSTIGTVSFDTTGVATFSFLSAVTFVIGDQLQFVAPSPQDSTLQGMAITLIFSVEAP